MSKTVRDLQPPRFAAIPPRPLPLAGIAGSRGKSTTAWLLAEMLSLAGWRLALWVSTGVYVQGQWQAGELQPWAEALTALQSGHLDFAIQELEGPVVSSVGLPAAHYTLAAVTTLCGNNEECLLSPEARQVAHALPIVAQAVHPSGFLVLNADDYAVLDLTRETLATPVLFALHPENPALRRHLEQGGWGVWIDDGVVVCGTEEHCQSLFTLSTIPFTLSGMLTFQVQNVLCATALARCLDLPVDVIAQALQQFTPDPARLLGSCNLLQYHGATILFDTPQHSWTLRALIRGIRQQPHRRSVIVSHGFAAVTDDELEEVGRLLGRLGGIVLLAKENLPPDRLARLQAGLLQNDIPPLLLAYPDQSAAIRAALQRLQPGDLCVILPDDPTQAWDILAQATGLRLSPW
jgi:cyanophycin synthetase